MLRQLLIRCWNCVSCNNHRGLPVRWLLRYGSGIEPVFRKNARELPTEGGLLTLFCRSARNSAHVFWRLVRRPRIMPLQIFPEITMRRYPSEEHCFEDGRRGVTLSAWAWATRRVTDLNSEVTKYMWSEIQIGFPSGATHSPDELLEIFRAYAWLIHRSVGRDRVRHKIGVMFLRPIDSLFQKTQMMSQRRRWK